MISPNQGTDYIPTHKRLNPNLTIDIPNGLNIFDTAHPDVHPNVHNDLHHTLHHDVHHSVQDVTTNPDDVKPIDPVPYDSSSKPWDFNVSNIKDDPAASILESMRKSPKSTCEDFSIHTSEDATKSIVSLKKWVTEMQNTTPDELSRNLELVSMLKELSLITNSALSLASNQVSPTSNPNTPLYPQMNGPGNSQLNQINNMNMNEPWYDKVIPITPPSPYYNFQSPSSVKSQPIMQSPNLVSPQGYNGYWSSCTSQSSPMYPSAPTTPSYLNYLSYIGPTIGKRKSRFGSQRVIVCTKCGTSKTPEWRRGPDGARTLCNACGLQHRKLVKQYGEEEATRMHRLKNV